MERQEADSAGGSHIASEHARHSQPWVSQISAQAITQVRNVVQSRGKDSAVSPSKRGGDAALSLSFLQQQMDEMEDRFSLQLQRLQTRADRLREAESLRWEERLGVSESSQRRLAELCKSVETLEARLTEHTQRTDKLAKDLGSWQKKVGEDMRERYGSIRELVENIACSLREESSEAAECRSLVRDHDFQLLELNEMLRIMPEYAKPCSQNLEGEGAADGAQALGMAETAGCNSPTRGNAALINQVFEARTAALDLDRKVELLLKDSSSMSLRLHSQEERLSTLRAQVDDFHLPGQGMQEQLLTIRSLLSEELLQAVDERFSICDGKFTTLQALLTKTSNRIEDLAVVMQEICAQRDVSAEQVESPEVRNARITVHSARS